MAAALESSSPPLLANAKQRSPLGVTEIKLCCVGGEQALSSQGAAAF